MAASSADAEEDLRAAGRCLIDCGRRGNMEMIQQLFKDNKAATIADAQDGLGNGALHYCGQFGHAEAAAIILSKGANPNLKNYAGETPLHKATWADKLDVVKVLCDNGANPNVRNKKNIASTATCRSIAVKDYVMNAAMACVAKQQAEERSKREAEMFKAQEAANQAGVKSAGATLRDEDFNDKDMVVAEGDDDE